MPQALLYFPILLVARLSWVMQSFMFVFDALPSSGLWSTKGQAMARLGGNESLATRLEVRSATRFGLDPPSSQSFRLERGRTV